MERRVETRLADAGLEHFSPFVEIASGPSWKKAHPFQRKERPLLPGYVFARFDFEDRVHDRLAIVRVPELVKIVGFGSEPVAIPEVEVDSLRILVTSRVSVASIPLVVAGDYVRVIRGPLAGAEGYVAYVPKQSREVPRIMVSVGFLQRSVSAEVDGDCLERCPAPVQPGRVIQMPARVAAPIRRAA